MVSILNITNRIRNFVFLSFFYDKRCRPRQGFGSVCIYAIVRNYDGEITVESEQGVGTMFRVMLPVVERDLPAVNETDNGK